MKLLERKKTVTETPFPLLLREAVAVERELRQLDAPEHRKLSAAAFIRDALLSATVARAEIDALRGTLEADPMRFPRTWAFIRQAVTFIAGPNCPGPPRDVCRLRFLGGEAALPELVGIGSHTMAAFALAAVLAVEKHPGSFGMNADIGETERQRAVLRERRTALLQRIEAEYGPGDLSFAEPSESACRAAGHMKVSFAISGGEVTVGPGCGERLVAWLVTRDVEV